MAECVPALIGATPEGKKGLLGFQVGVREKRPELALPSRGAHALARRFATQGCELGHRGAGGRHAVSGTSLATGRPRRVMVTSSPRLTGSGPGFATRLDSQGFQTSVVPTL